MIPLEKLRAIKHLITHANCPDGVASALIVKDALPDVRVSFVKYGSAEHKALCPEDGMIFCDFSPYLPKAGVTEHVGPLLHGTREMMVDLWRRAGTIVLDHHSRDVVEPYGELGVFGENDKLECGAWLAYQHVWLPIWQSQSTSRDAETAALYQSTIRRFARLAAIRDTWAKHEPEWEEACQQAGELVFWKFDDIFFPRDFSEVSDSRIGHRLLEKQLELARTAIAESCRFTSAKGTRVLMFQGVSATSDAAEILEKDENANEVITHFSSVLVEHGIHPKNKLEVDPSRTDLVVGFHYRTETPPPDTRPRSLADMIAEGPEASIANRAFPAPRLQLQFSTRSHTGFDCQALARAHGGNGHKAAAGFTVSEGLTGNPYETFRILLELWEEGQ